MMRRAQPWLGTLVDITIGDELDPALLQDAFSAAFAAVARVHRLMSFHHDGSDISRINDAVAGSVVEVHPHTAAVLELASSMAQASGGAFDIACAPRLVEWGSLPRRKGELPAYLPGTRVVRVISPSSVEKAADGWIDVGGIAKGYAVDLAIDTLRQHGIRNACVNAGGDLRVMGPQGFPVAVRDPHRPTHAAREVLLCDEAMATSAPYFSSAMHGDDAVSSLCNGLTGSAITEAVSVSVRAPSCAVADALTKVILATRDTAHPALKQAGASAFLL